MSSPGGAGRRTRTSALAISAASAAAVALVAATVLIVAGGSDSTGGEASGPSARGAPSAELDSIPAGCSVEAPERLVIRVDETLAHSPDAFTQGLVIRGDDLFESTGRRGESTLRVLDPSTGSERRRVELPDDVFGEGLAVGAAGELVQLTWTEQIAFRWDESLRQLGTFAYEGEGWGLTTMDDGTLVMSDGSDVLTDRDPEDFGVLGARRIRRADGSVDQLNELEWDGTHLWANRYRSDELLRIDMECGTVTGVADLSELRADASSIAEDAGDPIDVTNGIAYVPGTRSYLVTGKLWPTMYRVRIEED